MQLNKLEHDNIEEIDYVHIPAYVIGKNMLEIGVSKRIFNTHLYQKLKENDGTFTGLDIINRVNISDITLIEADVKNYDFDQKVKYDTILSCHTFEHIDLWEWEKIFTKLKGISNGYIVICLPYKETGRGYTNFPECLDVWDTYQQHIVFNITKKMMRYYFPGSKIFTKTAFIFRQDDCRLIWAIGRFIKRIFFGPIWPIRRNIYTIWKKKEELGEELI